MKYVKGILVCYLWFGLVWTATAQIEGSFSRTIEQNNKTVTELLLVSGNYFSLTTYESASGAFVMTKGGNWSEKAITYEFHTIDKSKVGQSETWKAKLKKETLLLKTTDGKSKWTVLGTEKITAITGAWLITGRKRNGEIRRRNTDSPRKTMKILTGSHFQWIAFNTETGDFFGTGGGTYTAVDGKYIENIGFFSRDDSRVGASLQFDFEVKEGDWHHSGLSSKGKPIYEIWSLRK